MNSKSIGIRFAALVLLFVHSLAGAADFNVTSPDFYYSVNGESPNPSITLTRGVTYTFAISTDSFHPVQIVDASYNSYDTGVANNNINSGTITFAVPLDAPDTLQYICSFHFFGGVINVIDPLAPLPPSVKVSSISLTQSGVTLKSPGTNGWTVVPEFSSNLTAQTWFTVPGFTNTLLNGTNVTTFNRLDPICGPNVFLRLRSTNN